MSVRSKIAVRTRLNKALDLAMRQRYRFVGDGIATAHLCEFMTDPSYVAAWPTIERHWQPGLDVRWRTWIMRRFAEYASSLEGAFAEFGTYRGGCASVVLSSGCLDEGRPFFLFDTFAGIPVESLTPADAARLSGEFTNTSPDYVQQLTNMWDRDNVRLVEGDILKTLVDVETGPLAFVHLDLNAVQPTRIALSYAYERLVSGGVVVLDDYGWDEFLPQRQMIDDFARIRRVPVIQFPTGTAAIIKAH